MSQVTTVTSNESQELEILRFIVGKNHYAVDVSSVHEIMHMGEVSKLPNATGAIVGITLVRGSVVTVVNMRCVLDKVCQSEDGERILLLCEFEQGKVAFCVDEVLGIHRIARKDALSPDTLSSQPMILAHINLNDRIHLLLDFNRILSDIQRPEVV